MIDYTIKKSTRARRLRITIHSDALVTVTLPHTMNIGRAENFVKERAEWIEESVRKMKVRIAKYPLSTLPKGSSKGLKENKEAARLLVSELLATFNNIYNLQWNRVTIKNTKSRWGSCSKKRNLNFNYKIVYLPKELAEYLVVHEMCHLKQMNHSEKFWELVSRSIPDYKVLRKKLKNI